MGMETRLTLKQTQRLVMTPMLQQAIKLLPLQRLELIAKIRNELTENPLLEEEQTLETDQDEEKKPVETPLSVEDRAQSEPDSGTDIDWETYFQNTVYQGMPTDYVEKPSLDAYVKKEVSIGEHLVWQLNLSATNDTDKYIGTILIGNINGDGYLEASLDEISQTTSTPPEEVERVLRIIQTFDPPGIGARNIKECLLLQAENMEEENPLVRPLIEGYIERLDERNFPKIAKELRVRPEKIAAAVKIIREMDPKPGASIEESDVQYVTPDVYIVKKEDGNYHILLNDDGIPRLSISSYYQDVMNNKTENGGATKTYLEEKYKSAMWLMKSVEQRRQTLTKVSKSIVKFQKDFFDYGLGYLKPLILKNVADDIEMHESTVSRVTSNKYIYTPQGLYELKFFFHKGVNSFMGGESLSSIKVRQTLKEIIAGEDHEKPFSDNALVHQLQSKNISIARRTVTKYRKELKLPAASKRRRAH